MARSRSSGDGDEYDAREEGELESALDAAMYDYQGGGREYKITVTAQIEWAGTVDNNGRGGVRTTTLDGISGADLAEVRQALARAQAAASDEPGRSYRGKSWQAQLHDLQRTARGREALSGVRSRETLRRYGLGTQAPGRETRERIARAHADLRQSSSTKGPRTRATRQVARAFTTALQERYGVTIRLRDIEALRIERQR